ncbi:MAG: hypothetical protein Q9178_001435 [Gyalolechia marmorata]
MLTLVSYSGGACGPEKILRLSRIRTGLDEVFIQVQSGNIRRLQQLFVLGGASPLDASDTGWTLLHYAISAGQHSTVKFLKDAGADVRAESTSRVTPFHVAWNCILSGCLDEKSEQLLRNVFDDDAQLDERQFTTLHKIVLGMIGNDLARELETQPDYDIGGWKEKPDYPRTIEDSVKTALQDLKISTDAADVLKIEAQQFTDFENMDCELIVDVSRHQPSAERIRLLQPNGTASIYSARTSQDYSKTHSLVRRGLVPLGSKGWGQAGDLRYIFKNNVINKNTKAVMDQVLKVPSKHS